MTCVCVVCGNERQHFAKGMCQKCYKVAWQREDRRNHPEKVRAWTHKNMKRLVERAGKWRAAHPEQWRQIDRAWCAKNRDKTRAKIRRWQLAHPDKAKAASKRWVEANPDRVRATALRRRARELGAPINDFTAAQWKAMKEAYGHRCFYCGKEARLTQDHKVPLSRGGAHTESNIVPACKPCNSRKMTKDFETFCQQIGLPAETNSMNGSA